MRTRAPSANKNKYDCETRGAKCASNSGVRNSKEPRKPSSPSRSDSVYPRTLSAPPAPYCSLLMGGPLASCPSACATRLQFQGSNCCRCRPGRKMKYDGPAPARLLANCAASVPSPLIRKLMPKSNVVLLRMPVVAADAWCSASAGPSQVAVYCSENGGYLAGEAMLESAPCSTTSCLKSL